MSVMPRPDHTSPDAAPITDVASASRRTRDRTAQIVPFRQDENVLRSFFAGAVEPTANYGLSRSSRTTLVALLAMTVGGAFVFVASQFISI